MEYDLKVLKINKNKIEQLNELSIYTVKDLVQHYPYRFEEMLETPLHDESKVIIEAQLIDEPKIFYKGRFSRLTFHVNYHEEPLTITIFNRHFLKKNMPCTHSCKPAQGTFLVSCVVLIQTDY